MPKAKPEPIMASQICARVTVAQKAVCILERMADLEGRHRQRNMGLILERIAALFERDPQKLVDLGLLTQMAATAAA